jgi:hypothetical protein
MAAVLVVMAVEVSGSKVCPCKPGHCQHLYGGEVAVGVGDGGGARDVCKPAHVISSAVFLEI